MVTDREIIECVNKRTDNFRLGAKNPGCRNFDENMTGDPIVWFILNGNSYNVGGHRVRLSSQIVACPEHEEQLIANGGWDGTGERQSK